MIEVIVEKFDLSAVSFALLGAGFCETDIALDSKGRLVVLVKNRDAHEDMVLDLIRRARGVSNSTPMLEIKRMAGCCLLGADLAEGEQVCIYCGAKKKPKRTGEPAWRVPEGERGSVNSRLRNGGWR